MKTDYRVTSVQTFEELEQALNGISESGREVLTVLLGSNMFVARVVSYKEAEIKDAAHKKG